MDKEFVRQFTQAMSRIHEDAQYRKAKERATLYKPIDIYADHKQLLSSLTMENLKEIARMWNLKKVSQFKKAQLVDYLATCIADSLPLWFELLNQEKFNLVRKIVNAGNVVKFDQLSEKTLRYFRARGVIFPGQFEGQKVLVIPHNLFDQFEKLVRVPDIQKTIKINDEIFKLVKGLLIYYGVIERFELESCLIKIYPKIKEYAYLLPLLEIAHYDPDILLLGELYFSLEMIEQPYMMLQEQLSRDIDYYPVTYQMAKRAGNQGYIDLNLFQERFKLYLQKKWGISPKEALDITIECIYNVKNSVPLDGQIKCLQNYIKLATLEQAQELGNYLVLLHNNSGHWELKGYSPEEISNEEQPQEVIREGLNPHVVDISARKRKVGRNEPCPCGSGKKYKQCCGR